MLLWEDNFEEYFGKNNLKNVDPKQVENLKTFGSINHPGLRDLNNFIHAKTGYYLSADGHWKFEVLGDDINWKLRPDGLDPISQVYQHLNDISETEVYGTFKLKDLAEVHFIQDAYPRIMDATVVFTKKLADDAKGLYDPVSNTITVSSRSITTETALKDTLRHEIQHAIQEIEGFGKGGGIDYSKEYPVLFNKIVQQMSKWREKRPDETMGAFIKEVERQVQYKLYRYTLGEMESFQTGHARRLQTGITANPETREWEYLGRLMEPIVIEPFRKLQAGDGQEFFKQETGNKLGSTTFLPTGEKLIQVMRGGNFTVVMHEFSHVLLKIIDPAEHQVLAEWITRNSKSVAPQKILSILDKVEKGIPLVKDEEKMYKILHEKFADSFEEYLRRGKAPSQRLKNLFDFCKNTLTKIYFGLKAVPGSDLNPEMTKLFDRILLGREEKFGGEILIPQNRVPNAEGKYTLIPPISYKIFDDNGRPSIKVAGQDGKTKIIDVENLIRGQKITPEQRDILGRVVQWISPYDIGKREQMELKLVGPVTISRDQLRTLPEKRLNIWAKKLGYAPELKSTEENKVPLYNRAQLEDLIWGRITEEARASERTADEQDLVDALKYHRKGMIGSVYYNWSSWIIDRVRDVEGELAKLHHGKGEQAISDSHIISGEQFPLTNIIQKLVRFGGQGVRDLEKGIHTKYGFISNMVAHIDQAYYSYRQEVGPKGKEILTNLQKFLDQQAAIAEREGMSIRIESSTGEVSYLPFHGGHDVFPRLYTKEFWGILTEADPWLRRRLAMALSEVNPGMSFKECEVLVARMSENSIKNKRLYMEMARKIPVMPTHLKDKNGRLIPLLETDLFDYTQKLQHKLAMRVGFFRQYSVPVPDSVDAKGNVVKSKTRTIDSKVLDRYVEDFQRDTGHGVELERLFNSLNGVPLTSKYTITPSHPAYQALKLLESYLMVKRALWMTKSMWVNIVEPTIKTPAMVGWKNYGKTILDFSTSAIEHTYLKTLGRVIHGTEIAKGLEAHDAWNLMRTQLMNMGTMGENLAKFTIDPNDAVRSGARMLSGIISKSTGTTQAITFGEYFSSWAGHLFSEQLRSGKGTQNDVERLRVIGYKEPEIQKMISGTASSELYDKLAGKMVRYQMGTGTMPAEKSLFHNWQHANTVIAFDKYGATTARYFNQLLRSIYQNRTGTPHSKYVGWRRLVDNLYTYGTSVGPHEKASHQLNTVIFTSIAAGIAMNGIRQLVTYGPNSFKYIDWDDPEENNATEYGRVFADAFMQSAMSGPLANIYTDWRKGQLDTWRTGSSIFLPINALQELGDLATGQGVYANKLLWDRAQAFMKSSVPVSGALATWLTVVGLGHKDANFEAARNTFFKWKNKHVPGSGATFFGTKDDSAEEFYQNLNHAYLEMIRMEKNFDPVTGKQLIPTKDGEQYSKIKTLVETALNTTYKEGLNSKGVQETEQEVRTRVAESFLNKRLVKKLSVPDRIRLGKDLNEATLQKLMEHDIMLEWVADKIKYGE